jgi:hypothetical protein
MCSMSRSTYPAILAHLTIEWYWSKFQREIIITFKNSSHLEWRVGLSDTILKGTHPGTIYAKFGQDIHTCTWGKGWNPINRFNITPFLCLAQARTWIFNVIYVLMFESWEVIDCSFHWYWWICWPFYHCGFTNNTFTTCTTTANQTM